MPQCIVGKSKSCVCVAKQSERPRLRGFNVCVKKQRSSVRNAGKLEDETNKVYRVCEEKRATAFLNVSLSHCFLQTHTHTHTHTLSDSFLRILFRVEVCSQHRSKIGEATLFMQHMITHSVRSTRHSAVRGGFRCECKVGHFKFS